MSEDAIALHRFWFREIGPDAWFKSTDEVDRTLATRFGHLPDAAAEGSLDTWLDDPKTCLAYIIATDQIPRNIHRGTAKAFAYDPLARAAAGRAIARGYDNSFSTDEKLFCYLPFEHSEDVGDQRRSITLTATLGNETYLEHAIKHKDIIERFGRFPHRNEVLGRESTSEETAMLEDPANSFGQ